MFCPNCKVEYREGFKLCSDCEVPLVLELTPETKEEDSGIYLEYEYVVSSMDEGQTAMIKSLLQSEGITFMVKGEANYLAFVKEPTCFYVVKNQAEIAKELLGDFI